MEPVYYGWVDGWVRGELIHFPGSASLGVIWYLYGWIGIGFENIINLILYYYTCICMAPIHFP